MSEQLFVDCDTVESGIWARGLDGLMDNGVAFVEKNAMCTGVLMDNGFLFAENLQAGWCVSVVVLYVSSSAHDQRSVSNVVTVLKALFPFCVLAFSIALELLRQNFRCACHFDVG